MAKTYETYKDSGIAWIGEIPSEWEVVRQKNVFTLGKELIGDNWATTQLLSLTTKGIKCISIGNTSGKVPDSYNTYQTVKPNNLVMCLFDLDCSAVFSGISSCSGMISPAYKVLTVNEGADPRYYSFWFDFIFDGRKYMYLSKNIRYSLTYDEFAALGIVYPSLSDQHSIASFLDTKCGEIDALISLQEEMISELQAYKQSVITEAVTKGLNPHAKMKDSGVEWIGKIPEEWKVSRFKTIATVKANLVHPEDYRDMPQVAPDCIEKGSGKLIKYQTVKEANIISDNHLFHKGQILYSKIRPTLNKVIIAPFDGLCCADMYPIDTLQDLKFFLYLMLSTTFNEQVSVVVHDRVKMPKINKEELDQIIMVLPPLPEQHSIATYLDEKTSQIDSLIALKQEKIQELKDYKKSIIYEYVTGKKRV